MTAPARRIVIVSGAPGAGKTSLAVPLAARLGFPLFSKDVLKQALTDALGDQDGDLAWSRRIGGAAMETLWSLAANAPQAVLEANFRPHSDYERAKLAALDALIVEVHCDCGAEETARRFRERAKASGHHAAHPLKELPPDLLAEYDRPVATGPVIEVDTRGPVDLNALVEAVHRALHP